ncbi:hypothetical protein U27_06262 [Candidatus Vecturithrix granuli]|uniref:ATPase n=1 Tax=Vecturithrix granuli TaxID=1499967 RepID=A0A081C3Y0_VECG1|nr:hypothetical protein U27_06262 [Candidatus Vecturithrix granuli]
MERKALLEEIANNWKLEAKEEDNERYFYFFNEVDRILKGAKNYVIGRKGTGKTAISEYITSLNKRDGKIFTEKLKFKNFPFNELYGLKDAKFTPPNQYITLWKHLIYSIICKMMLRNSNINSKIHQSLSLSYEPDTITSLPRLVAEWTHKDFEVLDPDEKSTTFRRTDEIPWIMKVDILEDIIRKHIDDSKYYIVFDELDEDYRNIKETKSFELYDNLITSLFKAVQEIRSSFRDTRYHIYPIIFLRDDIYGLIKDADKNKWTDFKIELDWDIQKIQRLIAFRISRAFSKDQEILPFGKVWNYIFFNLSVKMGNERAKEMSIFDYIVRSTQLRPRDFIRYIQVCAEETVLGGHDLIHPNTVKKVDKAFSNYLRAEIEDEIFPILPDISNIFRVLSEIRKQFLSIEEFKDTYDKYVSNGTIQETNVNLVLQLLYDFSVIGNCTRNDAQIFKYKNKEARLNFSENIVIHRGLYKALQIL